MDRFGIYPYEIISHEVPGYGDDVDKWVKGYFYLIYHPIENRVMVEGDEYFETEYRARMACIGHITLIEQGGNFHDRKD